MTCACGRPVNDRGRRCCLACRFAPSGAGHSRYCPGRVREPRRKRQPADFSTFDPYVIGCVTLGTPMSVHMTDVGEAVSRLVLQGKNDREIGELIGRSSRQVLRIRQRLGLPAVPRYRSGLNRVRS